MKKKRGRLEVHEIGPIHCKAGWQWSVTLPPETTGVDINCNREWKTEAGARRNALQLMADWGIEVEE